MGAINPDCAKSRPCHCAFFRIGRIPISMASSRSGVLKVKRTDRGPVCSIRSTLAQTAV